MTLAELLSQLQVKQRRLRAIFEEAGPDFDVSKVTTLTGTPDEKAAAWKAAIQEVDDLGKQVAERRDLEAASKATAEREQWLNQPSGAMRFANAGAGEQKQRSIGELLRESKSLEQFKANNYRGSAMLFDLTPVETKTLMTLSTLAPVPPRLPGIHPPALETRTVRDLFLQGTIGTPSFTYLVETTFTNAAAEVTEGAVKPESALGYTETTEPVQVIATFIPATRQILDDLEYLQSYIEGRLRFMVQRREEAELLTGNGTAPNLKGVLNRSGIQTYALSAENNMDAIYKGMVKVRNTAFAEPTAIVMHPNNMQTITLTKSSTGDYLYGNPTDPNVGKMLWGLEVRQTTAITANTGLVGAFQPDGQVFQRAGLTVTISTEHSDFFIRNQVAILAEERLGLAIYRPASFCTVTALT